MSDDENTSRYSSAPGVAGRFVAQQLLMKPYIWSAVHVHEHGRRNLDGLKPPFIAVANHSSHLDAPLIMGSLPRRLSRNLAAGAAADYFFDTRVKATASSLVLNAIPIERTKVGRRSADQAATLLDDGISLRGDGGVADEARLGARREEALAEELVGSQALGLQCAAHRVHHGLRAAEVDGEIGADVRREIERHNHAYYVLDAPSIRSSSGFGYSAFSLPCRRRR